jgi:tRNA G37 N-methylase Trm5
MEINQETIERLTSLRKKKKFTDSDWEKRGLNPSDSEIVNEMIHLTDICLDELLVDVKSNPSEKQLRKTLTNGLKRFKANRYDTEEKEFIGDEFQKIGSILGLNIADNLNDWLYGKFLGTMLNLTKRKEVIVDTKSVECSKCKLTLNLKITATRDGDLNLKTLFL